MKFYWFCFWLNIVLAALQFSMGSFGWSLYSTVVAIWCLCMTRVVQAREIREEIRRGR